MILKDRFLIFVLLLILSGFFTCSIIPREDGPYFGNGVHNGWADQNSAVIWTRLTENPELNSEGVKFLIPSAEEHRKLAGETDLKKIFRAQVPAGLELDEMEGACPGMAGEVRLSYHPFQHPEKMTVTDWAAVDPAKNFTRQWKLEDLEAGSRYVVKLEARPGPGVSVSDLETGYFRTPPDAEQEEDIDFCIVTCHEYPLRDDPDGHRIYRVMQRMEPDFFVHTGDIEYYDRAEPFCLTEELMRFKWDRLFALPLQREFYSRFTTYFMKDDHDTLRDDAFPGMTYGTVSWERGLEIFDREQFPSNDRPYKTVRWGKDLQIWLTEGRNFRSKNTDPDGPGKTIWGAEQKEWVFRTMKESDATFKLLISPDPILGPDRDNKKDNYSNSNFKHEGDEIREYLSGIDNVILCNGDRHWQYVTHWEDLDLWEFSCGAGSDAHAGGWNQADLRPEHRFLRVKGGFLRGRVFREDDLPTLILQHYDVNGNVVHVETFQAK
jgi:alkaline phosphatase D